MDIYTILLSSKDIDPRYMTRYIKFISSIPTNRKLTYSENHHILPRSMYPDYEHSANNIVCLSAKEHYIAHLLLYKAFPKSYSMLRAFWGMCNGWRNPDLQTRTFPAHTSSVYATLREQVSIEMSKRMTQNNPYTAQEIKNKIIEKHGGLGNASPSIKEKQKQTLKVKYGVENSFQIPEVVQRTRRATIDRNKDPEYKKLQRERIKESLKSVDRSKENNSFFGKEHSEETKKKISDAKKGRKAPRYCCMNCKKELGANNLTQHTNRCT